MNLNESIGLLVQESRELLGEMEQALLAIEHEGATDDHINSLFRAAHTIKGSAGLFGLDPIVSFTHVMESVMVRVRNREIEFDTTMATVLFECADHLGAMIDALENQQDLNAVDPAGHNDVVGKLLQKMATGPVAEGNSGREEIAQDADSALPAITQWHIALDFAPEILAQGMDPLSFIQYLSTLGTVTSVKARTESVPPLSKLEPERCYVGFDVEFESAAKKSEIEAVFEFVREGSNIAITPANEMTYTHQSASGDHKSAAAAQTSAPAGEHNVIALAPELSRREANKRGSAPKEPKRAAPDNVVIKIEARKLDHLIDAVGELVIRSASCQNHQDVRRNAALTELMESVGQLVAQIRDRALDLRMVPIGEVFQRFPRIVRDVSKELGKKIDLKISGAETELDKSMVEKLTDPLMHIVRNAIDHGIELVEQRREADKPEQGVVSLNAYHKSGAIVIEVRDDGRGLDTDRIFSKAVERGLVAVDARLTEREIFNLIFAPGFSTADTVTDLSGRGVGMDVVRQNIEQLRGSIDIASTPGRGTHFQIQLPLTLAIIDGFQVAVGSTQFVVPLDMVVECLDLPPRTDSNRIFSLRGQPLPYIRLSDQFSIEPDAQGRECLVVIACGEQRCGIVVNTLVGELQAVIKPLGNILTGVRGFSGSTILGDGRVALVLDIPALLDLVAADKSLAETPVQVAATQTHVALQAAESVAR